MAFVASSIVAILLTLTFTITKTKRRTRTRTTTILTTLSLWDIFVPSWPTFPLSKPLPSTFSKSPNAPTSNLLPWIVTKRSLFKKILFFNGFHNIVPFLYSSFIWVMGIVQVSIFFPTHFLCLFGSLAFIFSLLGITILVLTFVCLYFLFFLILA